MESNAIFLRLAIALGLGLLVGLQRERVQAQLAGIRTFALLTLLGSVCALVAPTLGGWVVGLGGVAVAALLVVGNIVQRAAKETDPGLTTEVAALLMYGVGAYLMVGHTAVAIAIGGGVALLLHLKAPMHDFVARIGEVDIKAMMQFALIALVIWPVLPDQTYDPYGVLNPHDVWLMVVLIVGISLGGYVGFKLFGHRAGALVGGLLGGLVSSTATTVSSARQARSSPDTTPLAALVIVIASAVAFARVLFEIAVVAPHAFGQLAPPLGILFGLMALAAVGLLLFRRAADTKSPLPENPAELRSALIFGGLYALVLFTTAAAKDYLGETGLYGVAALSGLHDLDAITLSTARLVDQGQLDIDPGWRLLLTAALSNLAAKAVLAAVLGGGRLLRRLALPYGVTFLGGLFLLFWPGQA